MSNITDERAARRFHHIATLERQLCLIIANISQAREHMKELREQKEGLLLRIRAAARDEGELPLFNLTTNREGPPRLAGIAGAAETPSHRLAEDDRP